MDNNKGTFTAIVFVAVFLTPFSPVLADTAIANLASVCVWTDDGDTIDYSYAAWYTKSTIVDIEADHVDEYFRHDHWAVVRTGGTSCATGAENIWRYKDRERDGSERPLTVGTKLDARSKKTQFCSESERFEAKSFGEIECCLVESVMATACAGPPDCEWE